MPQYKSMGRTFCTLLLTKQGELEKAQRRATSVIRGLEGILYEERLCALCSSLLSLKITKTYTISGVELINRQQLLTSANPILGHQVKLRRWVSEQTKVTFHVTWSKQNTSPQKPRMPQVSTGSKGDLISAWKEKPTQAIKLPADQSWKISKT